jgi:replicative DNA helicase
MANIKLVHTTEFPKGYDAADLSPDEVLNKVQESLESSPVMDQFISGEDFDKLSKNVDEGQSLTHFNNIDSRAPFPLTGVVVVAGRPGHGKSSLMRNIALRKALNGDKVVYLSYEYSQHNEVLNFISLYEKRNVSWGEVETTPGYKKIKSLLKRNLFISHKISSIEQIKSVLSKDSLRGSTVFLDYIQKIGSSDSRSDPAGSEPQIRAICNTLNSLVIENELLIVAGSQLTQSTERSPAFDVVKGGRTIEEVSSLLLRIWRHNVSISSSLNDMMFALDDYDFTIDVLKNRESTSGDRIGLYTAHGIGLSDNKPKKEKK